MFLEEALRGVEIATDVDCRAVHRFGGANQAMFDVVDRRNPSATP
jgi:hypothetical protein